MKILVVGPPSEGSLLSGYIAKVSSLCSKAGPFEAILCLGVFNGCTEESDEDVQKLLKGTLKFPVTTYFVTGSQTLPPAVQQALLKNPSGDIAENLCLLGSHGILTTTEGLRIAFLSGIFNADAFNGRTDSTDQNGVHYTEKNISSLLSQGQGLGGVDFLLTSEWPTDITQFSETAKSLSKLSEVSKFSADPITNLSLNLQPRYHFASLGNTFYEREPFPLSQLYPSRFIGLANFGNKVKDKKERWFYALNVEPLSKMDRQEVLKLGVSNMTLCPFTRPNKHGREDEGHGGRSNFFFGDHSGRARKQQKKHGPAPDGYVCKICSKPGHWIQDCPDKGPDARGDSSLRHSLKKRDANQCWFCLSNPSLEKHLLVTIGEDVYLALAKGGLLEWGGHLLIVPIGHVESTRHLQLTDSEDTQTIIKEMQTLKEQIQKVYHQQRGESMISFEMYGGDLGQGTPLQHMHIQLIPIPVEVIPDIQSVFEEEAGRQGLELSPDGLLPESLTVPYCRVEVPSLSSDGTDTPLVMVFVPSQNRMREFKAMEDECMASGRRPPRLVNLAFGRSVVAQLLGAPDKADWRNCLQSMEEEQAATLSIRALLASASSTTTE